MQCTNCGADVAAGRAQCDYCGSHLEPPAAGQPPSRAALFARIEASPAFAGRDAPARRARLSDYSGVMRVPMVFLGFFVFVTGSMALMAVLMSGIFGFAGGMAGGPFGMGMGLIPLLMSTVPLGMAALGVYSLLKVRAKAAEFRAAPVLARPAVIVARRSHVSGGGKRATSTQYHFTAELADGRREEFEVPAAELFGRVAEGDAGVLFTRAGVALDFDRVDV